MIGRLRGTLADASWDCLIVDAGGVGYRVHVPLSTRARLPAAGNPVQLEIHTHVRDDAIALYGFTSRAELQLFERLIEVGGVGPRLALTILSTFTPEQFYRAVTQEEVGILTRVPGVGKKTAQRLILELRERLPAMGDGAAGAQAPAGAEADALAALVSLGYGQAEAAAAVERALKEEQAAGVPVEDLVRRALRYFSGAKGP